MKAGIIILFHLLLFSFFCYAQDIVIKFPNNKSIREYVSCELKITSIRTDETITPSYELILSKKTPSHIKELETQITYYYGQNFDFRDRFKFILSEDEIEELNTKRIIYIKKSLPEMKREPLYKIENSLGYVEPDGEYIEDVFYKLVVEK
jgi:hypothetical protein